MENASLIPLIAGMVAVTYLPRLAPFLCFSKLKISPFMDGFLKTIPVAAIGALIIPGAVSATPDMPMAAGAGMCFTLVYGLLRGGIIIPVLGSVLLAWFMLMV